MLGTHHVAAAGVNHIHQRLFGVGVAVKFGIRAREVVREGGDKLSVHQTAVQIRAALDHNVQRPAGLRLDLSGLLKQLSVPRRPVIQPMPVPAVMADARRRHRKLVEIHPVRAQLDEIADGVQQMLLPDLARRAHRVEGERIVAV